MHLTSSDRFSFSEYKFEITLLKSNKSFSKKAITQIAAVPEFKILITLSDSIISVNELDPQCDFKHIVTLDKTKGASLFVTDLKHCRTLTGEKQYTLRMCVVVKRKLMVFYWKNRDFHDLAPDLAVPDTPRAVSWCAESLCVGLR